MQNMNNFYLRHSNEKGLNIVLQHDTVLITTKHEQCDYIMYWKCEADFGFFPGMTQIRFLLKSVY